MDKFCTITPTRGDRPELLEFCKHQLERMTVKPDKSYFIDYKPESGNKDLTGRIIRGIGLAKQDGFNRVYIVEDDDFYPKDYFSKMENVGMGNPQFIGCSSTLCYNLRFNSYQLDSHPERSSLFHTAFDISALFGFRWPDGDWVFLDLKLWRYAKRQNIPWLFHRDPLAISIKHNIGLVGGRGHKTNYDQKDPDRSYLKSIVDSDAFAFYQSLKV